MVYKIFFLAQREEQSAAGWGVINRRAWSDQSHDANCSN